MRAAGRTSLGPEPRQKLETRGCSSQRAAHGGGEKKADLGLLRGWSERGWAGGPSWWWELKPTWWEKCLGGVRSRGRAVWYLGGVYMLLISRWWGPSGERVRRKGSSLQVCPGRGTVARPGDRGHASARTRSPGDRPRGGLGAVA